MSKKSIKTLFIISIFLFFILALGWLRINPSRDQLVSQVVKYCNSNFENCIVSLDLVTDFDWDEVFIIDGATPNNLIESILKAEYNNPDYKYFRKIIFRKNNKIIKQEYYFNDPYKLEPTGTVFFKYNLDLPPYYLHFSKENAIFKIIRSDNEIQGKVYYDLIPIKQ